MEFFDNEENAKEVSIRLLGEGTQSPSPSPDPTSCLEIPGTVNENC
jgi:hypothetical protein